MKNIENTSLFNFLHKHYHLDSNVFLEHEKNKKMTSSLLLSLVNEHHVNSKDFYLKCGDIFRIPILDVSVYNIDFFPEEMLHNRLVEEHHCLPIYNDKNILILAITNPFNNIAISEYRFFSKKNIESVLVDAAELSVIINAIRDRHAQQNTLQNDVDDFEELELEIQEDSDSLLEEDINTEDAPITRFVNKIIINAINLNASDLHLEPYEKSYRIRARVDGILQIIAQPSARLSNRISARIKIMSQLDIAERRVPQDGKFKLKISETRSIDFRVSSCPTIFGEKIVLRIMDPASTQIDIELLGFTSAQKKIYIDMLKKPQGMIIVTGPTGSGKSVTLYTGLNLINSIDKNISTVEDPVELNISGINQVQVNNKQGLTFAKTLKSFLRQDPDIIMVGEIRDLETGEIAIKAAQTGHLVLTTLHTNSAPETINRMMDMGLPHYNIATSVSLIIAQRLMRKLCTTCKKIDSTLTYNDLIEIGLSADQASKNPIIYKANSSGCNKCLYGYKGRVGIYQVMPITPIISRLILDGANSMQIAKQAAKEGISTVTDSAINRVIDGITSLDEFLRVAKV